MIRLRRWLGWWLHRVLVYPNYGKNSVVIGRKDADNEVCLKCGASRTVLREMIADGSKGNLTIVDVILGNCSSCNRAIGGKK